MELKEQVDEACRLAEEFVKTYYENIDKRRHLMSKLYSDTAVFVWNGNGINSPDKIQSFFNDMPASDHKIYSLDSQPLHSSAGSKMSFVIHVCGVVNYYKQDPKPFLQNFIMIGQGTKWKIASDCFRLLEPISNVATKIESLTI